MPAAAQQLPEGPGKAELQKVCGVCHQAERSAAVRLTREGWEGVIGDMIARGARGSDEEFAAILDYLSKNFLGDAPRPLNINKANNIELESVAGLTRTEAAALLKWRQATGFCKSLDEDGRAALHDAYRRRLGVGEGPFELTARAWAVVGSAGG